MSSVRTLAIFWPSVSPASEIIHLWHSVGIVSFHSRKKMEKRKESHLVRKHVVKKRLKAGCKTRTQTQHPQALPTQGLVSCEQTSCLPVGGARGRCRGSGATMHTVVRTPWVFHTLLLHWFPLMTRSLSLAVPPGPRGQSSYGLLPLSCCLGRLHLSQANLVNLSVPFPKIPCFLVSLSRDHSPLTA